MKKVFLLISLMILGLSCGEKEKASTSVKKELKPVVFVSNYPLQFIVESIAEEIVEVNFPGKEAGDPALWKPKPDQIADIQNADLIIVNGASYEKWMDNVSISGSKIVNTTDQAGDKIIKVKETVTHSHGPEGEHAHMGTAFTTWLDFSLARLQARTVYEALELRYPQHKEQFLNNYQKLDKELTQLDEQMMAIVSKNHDVNVIFSHPVYQYLEKRYGIHGHSVHWEPDTEITKELWHDLEHAVHDHKAQWMVWENEPKPTSVKFLEEKGIKSIVFDPCGNIPETGDFLSVMNKNISELGKVFH